MESKGASQMPTEEKQARTDKRFQVCMPAHEWEHVKELADGEYEGNVSLTIRMALRRFRRNRRRPVDNVNTTG
jgi:hypothetical protein